MPKTTVTSEPQPEENEEIAIATKSKANTLKKILTNKEFVRVAAYAAGGAAVMLVLSRINNAEETTED
jgi:hypothetical protein